MLAKSDAQHTIIDEIRIAKVEGKDCLKLQHILIENFNSNYTAVPLYDLNVSVVHENSSQGILKDNVATRYRVKVTLNYTLINIETKENVDHGSIYIYSSYDTADSEFMNYISERYVGNNIFKELCEELKGRLFLVLTARNGAK